jgi:hypothetical protein
MHIEFERTGGVAGIRFVANVDTDTLSADEAPPVRRRLELLPPASWRHGLDAGGGSIPISSHRADPGRSHTVDISEGALPPSLRPLAHDGGTEASLTGGTRPRADAGRPIDFSVERRDPEARSGRLTNLLPHGPGRGLLRPLLAGSHPA